MAAETDAPLDLLWKEYSQVFREFDDLTLARWLAQTLGQIQNKAWRLSHPLLGAYRLASQVAHERQIWFKRLANPPQAYAESPCCRAPMLPLLTRDVRDAGLICQHCSDTLTAVRRDPRAFAGGVGRLGSPIWTGPCRSTLGRPSAQKQRRLRSGLRKGGEEAERLLARAGNIMLPNYSRRMPRLYGRIRTSVWRLDRKTWDCRLALA